MFLVEDVRVASSTQISSAERHKAFFASPLSKSYKAKPVEAKMEVIKNIEIDELPPVSEGVPIKQRKYYPGLASSVVNAACEVCGEHYHVEARDIAGPFRTAQIVRARHATVYVLRKITLWSLPEIGRRICRDHTTILHILRKMDRAKSDPSFEHDLETLKTKTIERLHEGGVEVAVPAISEQHVSEQFRKGEGPHSNARGEGVEGGMCVGHQSHAPSEV